MERQLERSLAYAQERKQFGQPIGNFQAVSHKLVDMKLRLETARLLLYRLGWLLDSGQAGRARLRAREALPQRVLTSRSSLDALQIHGGYGYMTEYELERDVRDAIGSRLYSGTSEIQRNDRRPEHGLVSETLVHDLLARLGGPPPRPDGGRRRRAEPHLRRARRAAEPAARTCCRERGVAARRPGRALPRQVARGGRRHLRRSSRPARRTCRSTRRRRRRASRRSPRTPGSACLVTGRGEGRALAGAARRGRAGRDARRARTPPTARSRRRTASGC